VNSQVVGIGAFGSVRYCTHRLTKKELAIKSIPINTDPKNSALLHNEISILQQVRHKNIIQLVDLMQDEKYIHIIMEKCQGGDLFDKIIKDGVSFPEKVVSRIIMSILGAVDYLHERNICHRDLKAEHIMLKTNNTKTSVKIIDFGLAVIHKPDDPPLSAFAGSAFTVAPEVIQRQYGKEVDLWSIGVIAYFLLTHLMPFNANSNEEVFKKIQSGIFAYPKWAKTGISEQAKDFIERLLIVNPKKRMNAKQALSHEWIRQFHNNIGSSNTDMTLAVVPYQKKRSTGEQKKAAVTPHHKGKAYCEDQRRLSEPHHSLIPCHDKLRRKPAHIKLQHEFHATKKETKARPPHQDKVKSAGQLHAGHRHGLKKEDHKLHRDGSHRHHP
jgi:calcium-dependent protein kinase